MLKSITVALALVAVCRILLPGNGELEAGSPAAKTDTEYADGIRLVSEAEDTRLRGLFPKMGVDFEYLKTHAVFYDDSVMPGACQMWFEHVRIGEPNVLTLSNYSGVHSSTRNQSGDPGEMAGNPNRDPFPWAVTAGFSPETKAKSHKFFCLPKGSAVEYWKESDGSYRWSYPTGFLVGEVLTVSDSNGTEHAFEVRTRRVRVNGTHTPEIYKPFFNAVQLDAELKKRWPGKSWAKGMEGDGEATRLRNMHTVNGKLRSVFDSTAYIALLPNLPEIVVTELLTEIEFRPVSADAENGVWAENDKGDKGYAPTSAIAYNLVPEGYRGSHVNLSSQSCARCHSDVGARAYTLQIPRKWYASVRGSEGTGIFSWHPFSADCISNDGHDYPVKINRKLIDLGILKKKE